MSTRRIDYIDYLKGLSIIWVVWYHTVHPWFVDFGFRMPLFFLASGIFFKTDNFRTYLRKKTHQLLIPFVFFSLIYYVYLIVQYYLSRHSLADFDFGCIWGVFQPHREFESFTVDPPLWFICALICQQLITWVLVRTLRRRWLIAVAAVVITCLGTVYVWERPTLFMFGRSLPYLVYYVAGNLYGKDLIRVIETKSASAYYPLIAATAVYILAFTIKCYTTAYIGVVTYFETFGLIVMLVYLFKGIHRFRIAYPFWFYGRNSYIVLGMHEIYQTIFLIFFQHTVGYVNVWIGIVQTLMSLALLWPTITLLNRHVPYLVGKGHLSPA